MAEPPELWVFVMTNLIVFVFGSFLTALSYFAYRSRSGSPSFRRATIGFGFITIGGMVEPIYQFGIKGDYHLGGRELLAMQGVEGLLFALGLGMLFYSIRGYRSPSRPGASAETTESSSPDAP